MVDGNVGASGTFEGPEDLDSGEAFLKRVGARRVAAGLDAKAMRAAAYLLMKAGSSDQAAILAKKAVELEPTDVENHRLLATILGDRLGMEDVAIDNCRAALELHPDDLEIRLILSETLGCDGRATDAEVEAREAVRRHPDDPRAHAKLAGALSVLAGSSNDAERLREESLAERQTVLRIDAEFPYAHRRIADLLEEMGRTEEVAAFREKAIRLWEHQATALEDAATRAVVNDLLNRVFGSDELIISRDELFEAFMRFQIQPMPMAHVSQQQPDEQAAG